MQDVLVTGGLGFIGSHLVSNLLEDAENEVVVVDNLATNTIPVDDIIEQISAGKAGKLTTRLASIDSYEPDRDFDVIYHLASVVGPAGVLEHAGYIVESIVTDTYKMIRLAQKRDARLINVSTSEVYGGGKDGLCSEDTPRLIKPVVSARLEYAAGKAAAEVAIENLCIAGKLDAITIRPFNVAGVRQSGVGGFVLPRFIGQAMIGRALTVFGDGGQIRAFTDARDIVSGMQFLANKGESGRPYNVGNPDNRVTILELAQMVVSAAGSSSEINLVDPKNIYGDAYAEADDKFPDAGRLMTLGWTPQYSLADMVRSTCEWMRELPRDLCLKVAGLLDTTR